MVVAYELPGVVSVRERGMGVRGGCAGATTVCSLCQDFRICGAMPEGEGALCVRSGTPRDHVERKKHVPLIELNAQFTITLELSLNLNMCCFKETSHLARVQWDHSLPAGV